MITIHIHTLIIASVAVIAFGIFIINVLKKDSYRKGKEMGLMLGKQRGKIFGFADGWHACEIMVRKNCKKVGVDSKTLGIPDPKLLN